jgi:hypothetical protein
MSQSQEERRNYDGQIDELRADLAELRASLEPVIEVWAALVGYVRVLVWIGKAAKWLTTIGAAAGIIWAALNHKW